MKGGENGTNNSNMSNNSLPTIERVNLQNLAEVIRKLDPELYLIYIALKETGVDPMILPEIIRGIGNLQLGQGFGKITVYMKFKIVKDIEVTENIKVKDEY